MGQPVSDLDIKITPASGTKLIFGEPFNITYSTDYDSVKLTIRYGHKIFSSGSTYTTLYSNLSSTSGVFNNLILPVDSTIDKNTTSCSDIISFDFNITAKRTGSNIAMSIVKSADCQFYYPSSASPTITVALSDRYDMYAKYGVHPKHDTTISATAVGYRNSYITKLAFRYGLFTNSVTFRTVSGDNTATQLSATASTRDISEEFTDIAGYLHVAAFDSRYSNDAVCGYKIAVPSEQTFVDYSEPTISINSVYRCDESGNADDDGTFAAVTFSGKCNHNITEAIAKATYCLKYKKIDTDDYTKVDSSNLNGQQTVTDSKIIIPVALNGSYEVYAECYDGVVTKQSHSAIIPSATILLEIDKQNNSIGLGASAEEVNTLTVGMKAKFLNGTDLVTPISVILPKTGWNSESQSVSISSDNRIPSTALVFVSPTLSSRDEYCGSNVWLSAVDGTNLTFICDSAPSSDITVNIAVLKD